MNLNQWSMYLRQLTVLIAACVSITWMPAQAATTDISSTPLGTRSGANVPPNMMFILDDSGSMARNYMPDQLADNICKSCDSGSCDMQGRICRIGIPPFNAYQINTLFYNPNVRYNPGVNYLNATLGNATPVAALNNPYNAADTSTTNIAVNSTDQFWCTTSAPSAAQLANPAVCRRTGINTGNPFNYTTTEGLPNTTFFNRVESSTVAPHYYNVIPREHCTDESLITCTLSATPTTVTGVQYNFPASVRWCRTTAAANSATAVSGNNVSGSGARDCQALVDGTYQYARYGSFSRVDILVGNTYPKSTSRTDCAGAVGATGCNYTEELQNYANWHSYYRTRILTMKTVPGRVFASIGNDPNAGDIRVGFVTINAADATRYLKISDFKNNTHRQNWFTTFYGITTSSSTPLRQALSRVGRHYAGITSGINSFMPDDPMTASCQRNYALLTTDGYWNGSGGQDIAGAAMGNTDNVSDTSAPIYVDRATTGTLDSKGTVSDTATPVTTLQQVICTGNDTTTFSSGTSSTTPCGCGTFTVGGTTYKQKKVLQRTQVITTTVRQIDGVVGGTPPAPTVVNTYQNITACTNPIIETTVTPVTDLQQVKCTGNATATFGANGAASTTTACGCSGVQTRIKQRTVNKTRTVITNDGVVTSDTTTNGTAAGTTFQDITAVCNTPLEVTTVTPITDTQDIKCTVNGTVNFANGTSVTCGCAAGQAAIRRRVTDRSRTVVTRDGVTITDTSANATTFSYAPGGTCTNQLVQVRDTPIQVIEEQIANGGAATTFPAINGISANENGSCAVNQRNIKRKTTNYTRRETFTDGALTATTTHTQGSAFANIGSCFFTTRTQQPLRETSQWVNTFEGNNLTSNFPAPVNGTTGGTLQQTGISCQGSGTRTTVRQRVLDYTRTVDVATPGGATTTTFSTHQGGTPTFTTPQACSTEPPVKTAAATTVVNNGTATVTTVPVNPTPGPAAPITNTGTTTTISSSGTNLAVTLTPNPQTTTSADTVTNNGGTNLAIALTPNPSNGNQGTPAATNNGGTTVTITMTPNPSLSVAGTATTTTTPGGSGDTLADVAMYYYKTDLRTTGAFSKNNVPVSGKFVAPHQHMITFTLGLGLDGQMTYRDDYETATTGDFFKIKSGATTCIWTTGTCNWPTPAADTATAIDDLWHAAVNGRGKYFSAKVPGTVEAGVKETLAAINVATGSAAAAATSTPNLTTTNNTLYSSTYRTVTWDGELVARTLDPATGQLQAGIKWSAATQLNNLSSAASDTRTIYTFDGTNATTKRKSFTYANLTAAEQSYFDNKCTVANWNQCTVMLADAPRLAAANSGNNLVNYLRGHRGNELSTDLSTGLFRRRDFLLGDTVNSKPAFMGPPELQFADAVTPTYTDFKNANFNRTNTLFVAANDGMVHAFNGDTGAEMWAYVPKQILPDLFTLANTSYNNAHRYFVDGSPVLGDAYLGGAWKTVLVGGFNSGGRGYYALDVTDPANPKGMWEICADAALCAISDVDMGLTYGPPIIGKMPAGGPNAGKWVAVVTSGYNNVGGVGGNGGGYLYVLDLATGAVLHKVGTTISGTNVGDTTTPSGLARISAYVTNFVVDNTISLIYGGDLLGNMWRFDMTGATDPTVKRIAQLKDGSSPAKPQSITTAPEITRFDAGYNTIYVGTGRFIGTSDIGDPAAQSPALPFSYQQSIYAFKDTNADLGDLRAAGASLVKQTLGVVDAATRSISNNLVDWTLKNGWYVDLNPVCVGAGCAVGGESPGERINIDMQLVRGTLVVISNEPNAEECSTGGDSFIYQFRYDNGSFVEGTPGGVVGTKIGNSLSVGIVVFQTTTGQIKSVITTADGKLPEQPINTAGGSGSARRAAWRELLDNRDASGALQ